MSSENKNDQDRTGVFVPDRSPEIERQIEETKVLLRDTRVLLDHITDGNDKTRRHVEELKRSLEEDLSRLQGDAAEQDASDEESPR